MEKVNNKANKIPFWLLAVLGAGLCATWITVGTIGVLAHSLKTIVVYILVCIVSVLSWPFLKKKNIKILFFFLSLILLVSLGFFLQQTINLFLLCFFYASLCLNIKEEYKNPLVSFTIVITIFSIYRIVFISFPLIWMSIDSFGHFISFVSGLVFGKTLWFGNSFAGIDYLILMLIFYAVWLIKTESLNKKRQVLFGILLIAGSHLIYLIIMSFTTNIVYFIDSLIKSNQEITQPLLLEDSLNMHPWNKILPWNLPLIGLIIHLIVMCILTRSYNWQSWKNEKKSESINAGETILTRILSKKLLFYALLSISALLLVVTTFFYLPSSGLKDKKIVIYEKGFLNWLKPEHGDYGRLSIGMYGMLPDHIRSWGGNCLISSSLSEEDIKDADLVIIIYPNEVWKEEQKKCIWDYVKNGGSLLVMGEHTVMEDDGQSRINEILEPTAMRVRFDSATFAVGGWLQSYELMAHPATMGIKDDRNQTGVVIGASVETKFPARPVITGKWGWSDYGDIAGSAYMGNGLYDHKEKIGDIILASEQEIGKGKVIVFGDTSSITNGIIIGTYPFVFRLFSYLTSERLKGCMILRTISGLIFAGILIFLIIWKKNTAVLLIGASIITLTLIISIQLIKYTSNIVPQGYNKTGKRLAYIDHSHISSMSSESWRLDGGMGLHLTLMRDDYISYVLEDFNKDKIMQADLYILAAPLKPFNKDEIKIIRQFVEKGGDLIITAGYTEYKPIKKLLSEFDFAIGISDKTKLVSSKDSFFLPMGFFKAPYLFVDNSFYLYVRFHAAWPVICNADDALVMSRGKNNLPVIIFRQIGDGVVNIPVENEIITAPVINKNVTFHTGTEQVTVPVNKVFDPILGEKEYITATVGKESMNISVKKGTVTVIGDTCFAMNKNLEHKGGEPFEGMRENAHFWRCFLSYYIKDENMWIPPRPSAREQ